MKPSPKERKAVLDSIRHWIEDIQGPLERGDTIDTTTWFWEKDNTRVRAAAIDCPLCRTCFGKGCTPCPYYRRYGHECDEGFIECDDDEQGAYYKFSERPTLSTCNAMIDALRGILE